MAVLSPVVLVGAAELALRVFGEPAVMPALRFEFSNALDVEAAGLEGLLQPHPSYFWEPLPGAEHPCGDRINELGLRGPLPSSGEGSGPRVVCLGDSCTFGVGLPYEQTFAAILERVLEDAGAGPVEVFDAGVPGYTIFQGRRFWKERVEELAPDLVVLYFGAWNDFSPAFGRSDILRSRWGPKRSLSGKVFELVSRLRVAGAVGGRLVRAQRYKDWRRRINEWQQGTPSEGYRVPPGVFARELEEWLDELRSDGIAVVLIAPELNPGRRSEVPLHFERLEIHRRAILDAAARRGLPFLDLRPLLAGLPAGKAFDDLVHPSAKAHAWIGLALAERAVGVLAEQAMGGELLEPESETRPRMRVGGGVSLSEGLRLEVEVAAGASAAGADLELRLSTTPADRCASDDETPLTCDAVCSELAGVPALRGKLDGDGRAQLRLELHAPAALSSLPGSERALAVAAVVRDGRGELWTHAAWIAVVP